MKDLNLEGFFFYTHDHSRQLDLKNKFTEEMSLLHKCYITNFVKAYWNDVFAFSSVRKYIKMRYKTVLLGWTPYQILRCSIPDATIFPTPKDIFNSLFLILSLLCLSILQEILLKDFSLTYLTVTFLLAAPVLSILILTSRAAIFILSLRDDEMT